MGTQHPPLPKKGSPQFSAHVYCGQTAEWIKMALSIEVGLGPVQIVLDGDTAPSQKRGHSPQFSSHLYCGQTAGCIKNQDATWYGRTGPSPGDFVLDGNPAPTPKGAEPHQILAHVYCGQTAAWIKMPLGTEVDLGLRDIVFDVDPATPEKGHTHPMSIVAKWLDG